MVRPPSIDSNGMKKGAWSEDEDYKLRAYIQRYGHWNWRLLPKFAGLQRCGKSCRLRWVNYLKPGVKRGNFTKEEQELVIKLHSQLGNKWSAIAEKLPGRTDNEIKNFWHTRVERRRKPNHAIKNTAKSPTKASPTNDQLLEAKEYYSSPEANSVSLPFDASYPFLSTNAQEYELELMLSETLLEEEFDYPELRYNELSCSDVNNWKVDDDVCGIFWNESSISQSESYTYTPSSSLQEEGLFYSDPLQYFDYQTNLF